MHARPGTNATPFEEFQQVAVTLVNAAHQVMLSSFGVSEQQQTAATAACGTLQFAEIAVRAGSAPAQFGQQPGFKVG